MVKEKSDPSFKTKGDVQNCNNYTRKKLMSHTMKIQERAIKRRLRDEVKICEQQYGLISGKNMIDALSASKMLIEKYKKSKEQQFVFMILGPKKVVILTV